MTQHYAENIAHKLFGLLDSGRKVALFVSGGSAIPLEVEVCRLLSHQSNLKIFQVDERFGSIGHKDSNWEALLQAGLLAEEITCQPILNSLNIKDTTERYNNKLAQLIKDGYALVGIFGIGIDGHTAGILPGSPAALENKKYVTNYQGSDFLRITLTPYAISSFEVAYLYAIDQNKAEQVALLSQDLDVSRQPAQVLKQIQDVTIITSKGIHT